MVNKHIIVTLFVTAAAAVPQMGAAQKAAYNTPGAGNPILPGYFADPTIKKFGDTYYIYELPMVAEPVSDRHSSGAARISRTGP